MYTNSEAEQGIRGSTSVFVYPEYNNAGQRQYSENHNILQVNTILLFCTKQLQQSHQSIANFYLKSVWGAKWWYPVASQHRKPWRQAAWGCETELQRSEFLAPGEACWVVSRAAGYTTRLFHSLLAQPQQQAYCLLLGLCMGLSEAFKTIQIPRVKSQGLSHANGEPIMNCNLSRIHIRFG